jgi:hypothetical protein
MHPRNTGTPPTPILAVNPVNPPPGMPQYPVGVTINGNELTIVRNNKLGFRAWFHVQISNWDPLHNGPRMAAYQVKIDCTGYYHSDCLDVNPDTGLDGLDLIPAVQTCSINADCRSTGPTGFGEAWVKCIGGFCENGYLDALGTGVPSPEGAGQSWCAADGCHGTGVGVGTCNYYYFSLSDNVLGHLDEGGLYYGGTLVLDLPAGAKGKCTVNLNPAETFSAAPGSPPIDISTLAENGFVVNYMTGSCCYGLGTPAAGCADGTPLGGGVCLNQSDCAAMPQPNVFTSGQVCDNPPTADGCCECVVGPDPTCDDGDACTIESCNNCHCERQPKFGFDPATQCCDRITGAVATRIDADQCTTDTCSFGGSRGVPQHILSPLGTPCNDWNVCTVNDACDGVRPESTGGCGGTDLYTAACEDALCPETNPNGVPCDDLNPCTMNDLCDALGDCRGTPEVGCDTFARTPINCACDVPTTRSIALLVPSSTPESPTALQVRLVDLQSPDPPNLPQYPPPNFSAFESGTCMAAGESNGCARWIGKPGTFLSRNEESFTLLWRGVRHDRT